MQSEDSFDILLDDFRRPALSLVVVSRSARRRDAKRVLADGHSRIVPARRLRIVIDFFFDEYYGRCKWADFTLDAFQQDDVDLSCFEYDICG